MELMKYTDSKVICSVGAYTLPLGPLPENMSRVQGRSSLERCKDILLTFASLAIFQSFVEPHFGTLICPLYWSKV